MNKNLPNIIDITTKKFKKYLKHLGFLAKNSTILVLRRLFKGIYHFFCVINKELFLFW